MTLEQFFLEKFRELSPYKQEEILKFLELLQQEKIESPTEKELSKAKEIIAIGLTRAMNKPTRPPELIWQEFEEVRARIAACRGSQRHDDLGLRF
jgi:hypothetical protein